MALHMKIALKSFHRFCIFTHIYSGANSNFVDSGIANNWRRRPRVASSMGGFPLPVESYLVTAFHPQINCHQSILPSKVEIEIAFKIPNY